MGGKGSIFLRCFKETPEDSNQSSIRSIQLPNFGTFTRTVSAYFSNEEEKQYEKKLKNEATPHEIQAPLQWQSSEIIGHGSFGVVLFAANMETGQLLAVKQIPLSGFSYESAHKKIHELQKEVEILSQLRHKNIVRYLGTEKSEEYLNIFLEYIAGGSISSLISKYGKFNETLVRVYTKQILEGLEYLHSHKIIHRDIKGANVLVSNDGECKLADFGAAKKIIETDSNARNKSLKGTINWMAPEVIKQEGHDRFADIWSLGCLVIEMITGKLPWYYKTNFMEVCMHVCNTEEPPELPSDISESAKDFILKCLNRDPGGRPNVYKLLRHPFLQDTPAILVEIDSGKGEIPEYFSSSTVFSSDGRINRAEFEERRFEEVNYEQIEPTHNVRPPHDITIISKKAENEEESGRIVLLRSSSESEEAIGSPPITISIKDSIE